MSDQIDSLIPAFVKAQGEISAAIKGKRNPHFNSKYADISAVIEAIQPAFTKHGLAFMQPISSDENGKWTIETIILHSSGEKINLGKAVIIIKDLNNPQSLKSSVTYFRRTLLLSAFGVAEEDDDGNLANQQEPKKTSVIPPKRTDPIPLVTPTQLKRLLAAASEANLRNEEVTKILFGLYDVKSSRDLNTSQLDEVCGLMKRYGRADMDELLRLADETLAERQMDK